MNAPYFEFGLFGESTGLVVALVLGLGFGWFLERGGMGNARKLAGQFYFTDHTVFKMMFSAIVTAMLGLFWLSRLGILDDIVRYGGTIRRLCARRPNGAKVLDLAYEDLEAGLVVRHLATWSEAIHETNRVVERAESERTM